MPSTRRAALRAVAVAVSAGVAGCGGLSGSGVGGAPPPGRPVPDYDHVRRVVDGERSLFRWTGDTDRDERQLLVTTADERDDVDLAADAGTEFARFVAETALADAALVLVQRRHAGCRRLGAVGVRRRPGELRAQVCRASRPADEACDAGGRRSTALALRVPVDGDGADELKLTVSVRSRCRNRLGPFREADG